MRLATWVAIVVMGCGGARVPKQPDEVRFVPQLGHRYSPDVMVFSQDGELLITGALDHARVWDLASGTILRRLDTGNTKAMHVHPNGRDITVVNDDGQASVWDYHTGKRVASITLPAKNFVHVGIAADGTRIAVPDHEGEEMRVHVVEATHGKTIRSLRDKTDVLWGVALSTDGRHAVTSGPKGMRYWDVDAGTSRLVDGSERAQVGALLSPDDRFAVATGSDSEDDIEDSAPSSVFVYLTGTNRPLRRLRHTGTVTMAFADEHRLVTADHTAVRLWDVRSGQVLWTVPLRARNVVADARRIAVTDNDRITILDLASGGELARFSTTSLHETRSVAFAEGGRTLIATSDAVRVWDLDSLRVRHRLWNGKEMRAVRALGQSAVVQFENSGASDKDPDAGEQRMQYWRFDTQTGHAKGPVDIPHDSTDMFDTPGLVSTTDAFVWETNDAVLGRHAPDTGAKVATFAAPTVRKLGALSPDGARLLTIHESDDDQEHLVSWNARTGQLERELAKRPRHITKVAFLDAERVVVACEDKPLEIWSLDGRLLHSFGDKTYVVALAVVDPGQILVGTLDGTVAAWTIGSKPVRRWSHSGHFGTVAELAISPTGRHAASASTDGSVRLWRIDNGASIVLAGFEDEWLVYSDDGYFDASKGGAALAAAVDGDTAYRLDQLAMRNNRPDLLLERMGLGDPSTISHFRAQYENRIARANLDPSTLPSVFRRVPTVTITSANVDGKWLELSAELRASDGLQSYNIWANGVPVFAAAGKRVTGGSASIRERIELTTGRNRIEVGVIGRGYSESLRAFRTVTYEPATTGDLYYLAFGVSHYRDPRLNLEYAHKDALDLGEVLRRARGYGQVHVETLTDDRVTVESIQKARQFLARAKTDDTVVMFVAGHGMHASDRTGEYYFATHGVNPDDLAGTAAPFSLIEGLLQDIAPRRKLFLMDTCESGELDPSERPAATEARPGVRSRALVTVRRDAAVKPRSYLRDRDRYIYNNVLRRSGAVVLSSSRGNELSYELGELRNGAFTEELMRALTGMSQAADTNADRRLTVYELARHAERAVAARTMDLQHPTIDRDNRDAELWLPLVPDGVAVVTAP